MAEPYRLAVMGDRESIQGFAAVGLDTFPCEAPDEAAKLFRRLCAGNYGVVYLTEETAEWLADELAEREEERLPAVIPIPGVKGNTGIGMRRLHQAVEKAVGVDIFENQQG